MSAVDPRLVAAVRTQLSRRPADAPRLGVAAELSALGSVSVRIA